MALTPSRFSGFYYFQRGWQLIRLAGIRHYVILPLLVNVLLMGSAFIWLFWKLHQWLPLLISYVPEWLQWLNYLLWPLAVTSVLLVFSYLFSTVANWIAAPFCGLLAERLEAILTNKPLPDSGWAGMLRDIPRMMKREWQKFTWYFPRALLLLLLYFIPGFGQTAAPILWFLFTTWTLAMQYCDYPFDNHKVSFQQMRQALRTHRFTHMQFGAMVSLFTLIPVLNLAIMPVAVCGATAMWVDRYREQFSPYR